ncbi:GGDEF domain-containing protein [Nocardia callitridis]|uniref:GGDEF domain-containing protein n=1 Tax=Nocardia callitridis TaxID=648753 RepID=A0ABP9L5G8_9NOCA
MTTSEGHSEHEQSAHSQWCAGLRWYAALFGVCAVAVGLHLAAHSRLLSFLTMVTVVVTTLIMIGIGLRLHRPVYPLPWYLLSATAVLFAIGSVLRDSDTLGPVDDVCTILGYLGLGLAALIWLRPRHISRSYDLVLDSALIGLGALLASWTFLISPILRNHDASTNLWMAATYPVLDALLLALVAHSIATTTRSEISLRLLHVGLIAVLFGDLGYSLDAAQTTTINRDVLGTPLLAAYATVGVAALHPTMAGLGTLRRIHPHRSRQRASVIAVALIVASLVPVVGSTLRPLDRVVVSSLFALMLIGVLVRSERAIVRSVRSEKRAQYQADHDMLTGLLNRSALLRAPSGNADPWSGYPVCLLFIDLDGFKMVNDSYGHAVGDELIANAASRIRRVVREDDIVARYGGDEFVVLSRLERREAAALAERLIGAFVRPFALSAGEIPITASIGIACGPRETRHTVHDLIRDADSAMYRAKEDSLGYAFHDNTAFHANAALRGNTARRNGTAFGGSGGGDAHATVAQEPTEGANRIGARDSESGFGEDRPHKRSSRRGNAQAERALPSTALTEPEPRRTTFPSDTEDDAPTTSSGNPTSTSV